MGNYVFVYHLEHVIAPADQRIVITAQRAEIWRLERATEAA